MKVFVDASVLFAALYSEHGFARDLLILSAQDKVTLIISQNIRDEVTRNILKKVPHMGEAIDELFSAVSFEIRNAPSQESVDLAATYVASKDAHVIAAAIEAAPDYLTTYDRKHLLGVPIVAEKSGLTIVTPDVIVQAIKKAEEENPTSS